MGRELPRARLQICAPKPPPNIGTINSKDGIGYPVRTIYRKAPKIFLSWLKSSRGVHMGDLIVRFEAAIERREMNRMAQNDNARDPLSSSPLTRDEVALVSSCYSGCRHFTSGVLDFSSQDYHYGLQRWHLIYIPGQMNSWNSHASSSDSLPVDQNVRCCSTSCSFTPKGVSYSLSLFISRQPPVYSPDTSLLYPNERDTCRD